MSTATQRQRNQVILRWVVLVLVGLFVFLPLYSMFKFSTTPSVLLPGRWDAWKALGQDPDITAAIRTSLELAALTSVGMLVLLLPTMVWVRLRAPYAKRLIEFLCLLPLTLPAIVIVAGYGGVQSWVEYLVTHGPMGLTFVYIILVLPYCYRALDSGLSSIDVNTLSEAGRSLGASWFTVITRIIMPNIKSAILSAMFLAVALVIGEFTFASLLLFDNLQVVINLLGLRSGKVSVAASLASIIFAFILLFGLSFIGTRRKGREVLT
jgi:putative spermidine/putrescine transport system permease protein